VAKASSCPQGGFMLPAIILAAAAALLIPTGARASSPRMDRVERQIVRQVNAIRRAYGLRPLHRSRRLARAADFHCRDMLGNNFFAHSSSNGQPMADRVESFRRSSWVGETLAYVSGGGGGQAARIVGMWMNSAPHREALLSGRFARIGVARMHGVLGGAGSIVFTADLASRH
jgi:uncharacterized protein YkwD